MNDYEEFIEQYNKEWHEISADKSKYISFNQYLAIQDMIGVAAEIVFQQSNDSIKNHSLSTRILQGPGQEFIGLRFIKWLKKKLFETRPERFRIVLDDKYFMDIDMNAIIGIPFNSLYEEVLIPRITNLIKASQDK